MTSKGKAKELTNIPWTKGDIMKTSNTYLKELDKEAKNVQKALMMRPEVLTKPSLRH